MTDKIVQNLLLDEKFLYPVPFQPKAHYDVLNSRKSLIESLIVHPFGQPGRVLEGLFCKVARILRSYGIPQENTPAALIILSVLSSVQIGMPLAIVLRVHKNKVAAEHLLNSCLKFAPKGCCREFRRLKPDDFYSAGDDYCNQVLVCRELSELKKIENDLKDLILNGQITIQVSAKTKFGNKSIEVHVTGPVAFIGIETEDGPILFDHPSIIRVPVFDCGSASPGDVESDDDGSGDALEINMVKDYLSRPNLNRIYVPYRQQLWSAILQQRPSHHIYKGRFILKLLSVLTILNNPEPKNGISFLARHYNSSPEDVQAWLQKNYMYSPSQIANNNEMQSGKIEYYIVKRLLDGIIPVKEQLHSPISQMLFETVKKINFRGLEYSTLGSSDIATKLYELAKNDLYWAKIDMVYRELNKGGAYLITVPVIESELSALKKTGLIERRKFRERDDHGYYVTKPSIDGAIIFPEIAEIFGSCSDDQLMEIFDPISGSSQMV
jgi:hypothetical protein